VPAASVVLEKVPSALLLKVAVPKIVLPFLKLTVPVGVAWPLCPVTVPVSTTDAPTFALAGVSVNATELLSGCRSILAKNPSLNPPAAVLWKALTKGKSVPGE
jgi:hypothetical protein